MTNEEKIKLVDHLLEEARKPEYRKMVNEKTKEVLRVLVKDGDENYWISISYPDTP